MQNEDEMKSSSIDVGFGRVSFQDAPPVEDQVAGRGPFVAHDKALSIAPFDLEA